jgi:hypothetical protein
MSEYSRRNARKNFFIEIGRVHDRVKPCFMTGKGCVYGDRIEDTLGERRKGAQNEGDERPWRGFVIMPFRPNLKVFLENCLKPFFQANYGPEGGAQADAGAKRTVCLLERGDEVSRPGIVICEGICRRIQEADFIVADVSVSNDNVFYELGLAYGIGHKIAVIHQANAPFGKHCVEDLLGCQAFVYKDLALIKDSEFEVSTHFWQDPHRDSRSAEHTWQQPRNGQPETDKANPQIRLFEMMSDGGLEAEMPPHADDSDIRLLFRTHVKSHVGLAMERIYRGLGPTTNGKGTALQTYRDSIINKYLREASEINPKEQFSHIRDQIDSAYCIIIRTGESCHAMSYFWLGYAHARGKNVVPITVLEEKTRPLQPAPVVPAAEHASNHKPHVVRDDHDRISDLAFDIRAQRHMIFDPRRPDQLEHQVEQTLKEMITSDFSAWSRKRFWEKVLGRRGEVSILTGGLHSQNHNREMIGDWDLRAASELTTYFSKHQYNPRIETPVYQLEYARDVIGIGDNYIDQITEEIKLAEKTCIIIASPDVNPLTEIVLGKLFGVTEGLFTQKPASESSSDAVEVLKVKKGLKPDGPTLADAGPESWKLLKSAAPRSFFREYQGCGPDELRGFRTNWSGYGVKREKTLPYHSQDDKTTHDRFKIYAHLVVAKNVFVAGKQRDGKQREAEAATAGLSNTNGDAESRYIIVLNGVSGPATFALTHVLTGGGNEEFVFYGGDSGQEPFDPSAESEHILDEILRVINSAPQCRGAQCFIEVDVGPAPSTGKAQVATFDWRRIRGWRLANNMLGRDVLIKAL